MLGPQGCQGGEWYGIREPRLRPAWGKDAVEGRFSGVPGLRRGQDQVQTSPLLCSALCQYFGCACIRCFQGARQPASQSPASEVHVPDGSSRIRCEQQPCHSHTHEPAATPSTRDQACSSGTAYPQLTHSLTLMASNSLSSVCWTLAKPQAMAARSRPDICIAVPAPRGWTSGSEVGRVTRERH